MIKRIPLLFIFCFMLYNCTAQQVFVCKSLGFKFVIDCECINLPPYNMNTVPRITYILKNGPIDGKDILLGSKIFMINDEMIYGKTGEELLALLEKTNSRRVKLLIGFQTLGGSNLEVLITPNNNSVFPEPNYSPDQGGPKLLGIITSKAYQAEGFNVGYENGDRWTGLVINKVYPDYSDTQGKYSSHEAAMKIHYDLYNKYQNSLKIIKAKENADAIGSKIIADRQKAVADSINLKKYQEEQFQIQSADKLTAKQIIAGFDASFYKNNLICGIGVELQSYFEGTTRWWQVSYVKPGSAAWFGGLDSGDVFVDTKTMSKIETTELLSGNLGESVSFQFMQTDAGWFWFLDKTLEFLTPLNLPESFTGGCVSGNCENGFGTWVDAAGNISTGNFQNNKLNGTGTQYLADGSLKYSGNFVNGKKSGSATAQIGRGIQSKKNVIAKTFSGEYKDDMPYGIAKINSYGIQVFEAEYASGKIVSQKMTFNNGDYCTCDPTTLVVKKCYNKSGEEINYSNAGIVKEIPAGTVATNSVVRYDEPAVLSQLLLRSAEINASGAHTNQTYSNAVLEKFTYSQPGKKYVRLSVPPDNDILFEVFLEHIEMEKVKINSFAHIREGEVDLNVNYNGGVLPPDGFVSYKGWSYHNNTTGIVEFVVEFDVTPASKYNSRTICWHSSLVK